MSNNNKSYNAIADDDDEESTPLTANNNNDDADATTTKKDNNNNNKRWTMMMMIAIISVVVGIVLGGLWGRKSTEEQLSTSNDDRGRGSTTTAYRPVCEYYDKKPPVLLIQTSMTQPSLQWSEQTCLKKAKPNIFFSAPDAILKVNFSQIAFEERGDLAEILGFGGAFTQAAALNYNQLSQAGKDAVMELLFGKTGLGYTLGRIPINSVDFSTHSYSFDETVDDFELRDFDMQVKPDVEAGMVDMARRATSIVRSAWWSTTTKEEPAFHTKDGILRLLSSPWSPPAWMKKPTWQDDDKDAVHASNMTYSASPNCLREGVGPDSRYAAAWALYFSKWITAYQHLGLPFWAVTVQNEPEFSAPWEACSFTPNTEKQFVSNHLGPRLARDHPGVRILMFDHNKDHMNTWGEALLNSSDDDDAAEYIDGLAYHWYAGGMDRLLDGALGQANMHRYQEQLQRYGIADSHIVLGSESCHCPTTGYAGGDIQVIWARAERYAHSILADLAAGSNGWVEWNLILDGIGGPNHLGNLCETTLLSVPHRALNAHDDNVNDNPLPPFEMDLPFGNVSIGDGRTREELNALGFPAKFLDVGVAVQPMYYYMGHISRHVRPGSKAVMGLVDNSDNDERIFRPRGAVTAGGGLNDLARYGIELTVWPCEGSTRQRFYWKQNHQFVMVKGHDWLGNPTTFCIARKIDKDFRGLRLVNCREKEAGVYEFLPIVVDEEDAQEDSTTPPPTAPQFYHIMLMNHPTNNNNLCLVVQELQNKGGAYGPRGGAQVSLGDCDDSAAQWKVNETTGEAVSMYFQEQGGQVCLTTGWPFLQMGAFVTPPTTTTGENGRGATTKTVVILNEARDAANYAVQDEENGIQLLRGSIPPRSIQTLLLE